MESHWRTYPKTLLKTALLILVLIVPRLCSQAQNVVGWGNNSRGQITIPAEATNVVAVAAGWYHSLALRADGTVITWGIATNVPANVTNAIAIGAGANHSLALLSDGTVSVWGDNSYGQANVPTWLTNVIAVASGYYHNLALRSDGTVAA